MLTWEYLHLRLTDTYCGLFVCGLKELSSLEEKMEYQLEERTRDMQDMLESCQTKVRVTIDALVGDFKCRNGNCEIS